MASELSGRERIWRALHHQEADRVGIKAKFGTHPDMYKVGSGRIR